MTVPYGVDSKKALVDVVRIYCQYIRTLGLQVRRGRCDATSMERSREFKDICAEFSLVVVPAPPEEQNKDPNERTWQTIQNDASANLIGLRNISSDIGF